MKIVLRLLLIPSLIIVIGSACSFSFGDTGSNNPVDVGSTTVESVRVPSEEPTQKPTDEVAVVDPTKTPVPEDTPTATLNKFTIFNFVKKIIRVFRWKMGN
jgi:hypothetical protein